ncbi:MAG: efflux transporter outer membrane subunit [Magnetococcales bacterium]|nr:efflux transporter outer membrane subunit [Magnetococcales bacterium]
MIDRRLSWMMVLPWLAGCSWNGSAIQPDPGIPAQWPGEEMVRMTPDAEAGFRPMPWRELYADPQLRTLIEAALETSRDLRAATARMEKAAALLGVAGAARVPTLQVEAGHLAARTPGDLSSRGQATISHREDAGLSLPAFEIDLRGRLANLEEGARAGYLASGEATHAARVVLIAQVAETFVLWREMEERSQLARTALETQQQARALVGQRVGAGVAQAQTGLKAAMVLEGMRADLAETRRQAALARNALQLLTGTEPDVSGAWPALAQLDLAARMRLELPDRVLTQRPDVRAAEQRLLAANANIDVARSAFWPRILRTTSAGSASAALSGLFGAGSAAWSFVPRIDLPIFDLSRRKNELAAAESERAALLAEYEKVVQQAFREVADALTSRGVLEERLQALIANRDAQKSRLSLIEQRYRVGLDGRQALLEAQQELHTVEQQVRAARARVLVNQIQFYKALGGGVG